MLVKILLVVALIQLVAGCSTVVRPSEPIDVSAIEQIQQEIAKAEASTRQAQQPVVPPAEITDALLPSGSGFGDEDLQERFDVVVDQAEASDFFYGMVEGTRYSMVVHPEVSGTISLNLRDATVDDVMAVVKEVYGYPYKKRGSLYQVLPAGLQTEVFKIDYLNIRRQGSSRTLVTSGSVSDVGSSSTPGSRFTGTVDNENGNGGSNGSQQSGRVTGTQIVTSAETDFWTSLEETLQVLVQGGEGQSVVVTPQAGLIVVKAFSDELDLVRDYLRRAELILRRQVILEAKILEVELSSGFQSGIDWTKVQANADETITASIAGPGQPLPR